MDAFVVLNFQKDAFSAGGKRMTNNKIREMLNQQLTKEFYSAYLYLAIANYYTDQNLDGFANWFEVQAKEELDHALLFRKYLLDDGATITLEMIEAPNIQYTQLNDGLIDAYAHEQMITASINDIYFEALNLKDFKTTQFLDWFVKEQGEEEKNASDLCKKYDLFGSDAKALYMLNSELLARVYTAPSLVL